MKNQFYAFFLILVSFLYPFSNSSASNRSLCDSVLVPTYAESGTDYHNSINYFYENYEKIYDLLKNNGSNSTSLGFSSETFNLLTLTNNQLMGNFDHNETKEHYYSRLKELYTKYMQSGSTDYHDYTKRIGLPETSTRDWLECQKHIVKTQDVRLFLKDVTSTGFTLKVLASAGQLPKDNLYIEVDGGNILNASRGIFSGKYEYRFNTEINRSFIVRKTNGRQFLSVTANILRESDSLSIDLNPRPDQAPVKFTVTYSAKELFNSGDKGFRNYDETQNLIVSDTQNGGPSENNSFKVNVPKAGTYKLESIWASGERTQVFVYGPSKQFEGRDCAKVHPGMEDALISAQPNPTGGWKAENLTKYPDKIGEILLPKGESIIMLTSVACGGGLANGRIPSIRSITLTEL